MENQKININTDDSTKEVIIREGAAQPIRERQPLQIAGQISTVSEYIEKRGVDPSNSHLLVRSEQNNAQLALIIEEISFFRGEISGQLNLSQKLMDWEINVNRSKGSVVDLSKFMKIRKADFADRQEGMKVISELKNFRAKVERDVQNNDDHKGNARYLRDQAVDHNLPESFALNIPLFEGEEPKRVNVEIVVDPDTYGCFLVSEDLEEMIEHFRDERIEEELSKIRELAPDLPVIYK